MWIYFIGVILVILIEFFIAYWCEQNLSLSDIILIFIIGLLSWFALVFALFYLLIHFIITFDWDKDIIKFKK